MSITTTEIDVPNTTATVTPITPGKPAPKPRVVKPAAPRKPAAKPADKPVTEATVKELETRAADFITTGAQIGLSLVDVIAELFTRKAWEAHGEMTYVDYFHGVIGIGADAKFVLPRAGRQVLVKKMAGVEGCLNAHLTAMTGASLRTILTDRAELGVSNVNRQEGQHKDDQPDDNAGDETGDDTTEEKPVKSRKSSSVNVLEIVDRLQDATYLMQVIAHASARLTELATPKADA
jgi:hypothetical protein